MTSYKDIWRKIESLQENQVITANHRGFQWDLSFEWSLVLPKQESIKLKKSFKFPFPIDFQKFLIDYSNGAKLYYDHEYGQWGYWLYSDRELISK